MIFSLKNGKNLEVKKISFHDVMFHLMPGVLADMMKKVKKETDIGEIMNSLTSGIMSIIYYVTNTDVEYWKTIEPAEGVKIINHVLKELTNENFITALSELIDTIKITGGVFGINWNSYLKTKDIQSEKLED